MEEDSYKLLLNKLSSFNWLSCIDQSTGEVESGPNK